MTDRYFAADGTPNVDTLAELDRPSKMLAEWEDRAARLEAAKAGSDSDELEAAKRAVFYYRSYWRAVGEALGLRAGPDPLTIRSKVGG